MVLLLLRPPPACKGCYTSLNSNVDLLLLMRISWYEIGRSVSKFQCGSIITEMDAVTNKLWPISKFQCGSIITCATLEKNKASVSSKFQCGSIITQRDDQRIFLLHPLNSNVDLLLPKRQYESTRQFCSLNSNVDLLLPEKTILVCLTTLL